MVKTKNKKLRNSQNGAVASTSSGKKYGVDELLEKAETLMGEFQFDLAEKFCEKALKIEPDNESALLGLGEIHLETGNLEKADENFRKAVELYPNSGSYTKYLQLGQLNGGREAEGFYLKAIELMRKEAEFQKNTLPGASKQQEVTDRDISEVYCAIAELHMTDLCEVENAESLCHNYLKQAVECDGANPNAYQTLASFYISADKIEEAKEAIEKSVQMWLPQIQKFMNEPDTKVDAEVECDVEHEKRKECAKILMELEKFEMGESVLDTLIAENDQDSEVWYLYGWICYLQGESRKPEAKAYLRKAKETLETVENFEDNEIYKHVKSLLDELDEVPELNLEESDAVLVDRSNGPDSDIDTNVEMENDVKK